jgi:Uma2 family endonuclease
MSTQAIKPKRKTLFEEFPDLLELEEGELADGGPQHALAHYLESLLKWFYRSEHWYVSGNMYVLQHNQPRIAPNVFICFTQLSEQEQSEITSWDMREPNRPAPRIVFEIASETTFEQDITDKITSYQQMGVEEYFAYDPATPRIWTSQPSRLRGWRYANGNVIELNLDARGWMWSQVFGKWLVPDGRYLRLYHENGQRVTTAEEVLILQQMVFVANERAERAERWLEQEQQEKEEQRQIALKERQARLEAEQREAEAKQAQLAAETLAEQRLKEVEEFTRLLKERGIDLNELRKESQF